MKINRMLYKIAVIILLIFMFNSFSCYAKEEVQEDVGGSSSEVTGGGSSTVSGDSSKGLPSIDSGYNPVASLPTGGRTMNIVTTILSILTVLGIIAIVVSITLIGFTTILGSASEKAQGQEKYVGLFIASLLITGGSVLAKMIISVAESL